jgi:hypothetical protein
MIPSGIKPATCQLNKYHVIFETPTVSEHKKFCFGLSAMTMYNADEDMSFQ